VKTAHVTKKYRHRWQFTVSRCRMSWVTPNKENKHYWKWKNS
jgi:hypothetical protein